MCLDGVEWNGTEWNGMKWNGENLDHGIHLLFSMLISQCIRNVKEKQLSSEEWRYIDNS